MADAIARMGTHYGRIGLATPPDLIQARQEAARSAAGSLKIADIPDLIRCILGLKLVSNSPSFLISNEETHVIRSDDVEARLLTNAIAGVRIESKGRVSDMTALALATSSFGGVRKPYLDDNLLGESEAALATVQSMHNVVPNDRTYNKQPQSYLDSIESVRVNANPALPAYQTNLLGALEGIGKYAEAGALASAKSDNEILHYVQRLQEELRIYWWVTSGWCVATNCAYKDLSPTDASIRAGFELAEKDLSPYGLFATPALLDMVVSRGRTTKVKQTSLASAVTESDRSWRTQAFSVNATNELADLVPLSSALGLAALSDDEEDWKPRFKRLTGIDANTRMQPVELGLQLYREQLLLRALAS